MSKKTENIHKSLDNLLVLKKRLETYNQQLSDRELKDIEFTLDQEIKNLKFWIDSLYLYNGKSTSNAKKKSSRENGKKGGRPPKLVTELKKRRKELVDSILPDLENKKKVTLDFLEEQCLAEEIEKFSKEVDLIDEKLNSYKN